MKVTLSELAKIVGAKNDWSAYADELVTGVEFDSRKVKEGDLFVPLKGERDGHDFIEQALAQGARLTLSERSLEGTPHLLVEDVLLAFQQIASDALKKSKTQVIAVTGSNGKTTTKDMIASLLATTYKTYKTQGNYNNEIGLPYTILQMPDDTEKLVLEMGQDHLGDIHLLSEIAHPDIAVVTMIGEAHLEFFGSREKIAEGKMQIVDGMAEDCLVLLPGDSIVDPYLPQNQRVVRFGEGQEIAVTSLVEEKGLLDFQVNFLKEPIRLAVNGKYNASNAMVAAYVAKECGVTEEAIQTGFARLELTRNRTEWKKAANGADILSDVYNANPTAMQLILETFSSLPSNAGGKKIAVLADMKELGPDSVRLHTELILSLSPDRIDFLVFYGEDIAPLAQLASQMYPIGRVYYFQKNAQEDQYEYMVKQVQEIVAPQDQILLKGSNSMGLSRLVHRLEAGE
ncbi:UDP-N-acetylmuramoyl-tripeptide--D-alanyl-D-alanine ligase [Streptococcus sp. DD13]|uniref:UDP-N-acetylmuramoyl-tripeptide--D-alanyl-D- alanine ligase n=1 Tax=Streptococcus sp. DD13 TaxID=1777881 RepID=UPI00079C323B|nr:UDP-N-acetylmuramoyl-tripeptide--D-alanyl-D-alanine ligase [Streptococcus sp. DD13]KXT79337.1 UDP-N-acetylmuramoylalanyl-D-glutamyl-2,6- diaminopimelate--D-alanyl-D-alanine ligase [Streptococcus sp. DD13]